VLHDALCILQHNALFSISSSDFSAKRGRCRRMCSILFLEVFGPFLELLKEGPQSRVSTIVHNLFPLWHQLSALDW
jgi:hypothetical protein